MSTKPSVGRTVLQVLRTLLWVVIAVCMVKFAFFPSTGSEAEGPMSLDPTADFRTLTVTAERGDITNTLDLSGTIESDPAAEVRATLDGEVIEVHVADGAGVEAGAPILTVRKTLREASDPVLGADGKEEMPAVPAQYRTEWVVAPTSGTLHLGVLKGQQVGIGDVVATIQPPTFSAVASLTADQMYRFVEVPETATVTIKNGPAPFECTGLRVLTPQAQPAPTGDKSSAGGASSTTGIQARCAIPGEQKVFPGLQVSLTVTSGEAKGVLTLPVTAVEGRFQKGIVHTPAPDGGEAEKVEVGLGLTDGKRIEITSGLDEGREVLEFVPGQTPPAMECDPVTGEGC